MSGRGGRGRGGRFGRGGGPPGPQAKDDDGTVIGTEIAGPPPLFPVSWESPVQHILYIDTFACMRVSTHMTLSSALVL
eukprot:1156328-Pelagomonas_calceolata.AAC.10